MTFAFKTYGCRLNMAESAQFERALLVAGFDRIALTENPELVIVYSCTVTQKAESECLKFIRQIRARHPSVFLVLAGCAAETVDAEIASQFLDLCIQRADKKRFAACVIEALIQRGKTVPQQRTVAVPFLRTQRATLKVQDGCNFFCSYCIVPHVRGAPQSKPLSVCLDEARRLIDAGFHELVVTGCNMACYNDNGSTLPDLLEKLLTLKGLGRIRLGSIEPGTVERRIIELMEQDQRICRFLHIPVQHCDPAILQRMRRRYTIDAVFSTLDAALERIPELGLGVDLIVGFPGETEEAYQRNCDFVERYPITKLHVFPYSERPGTPAATFTDRIPVAVRRTRARQLIDHGNARMDLQRRSFIGRTIHVLVEKVDAGGIATGWSSEYLPCVISGCSLSDRRQLISCTVVGIDSEKRLVCS